MCETGADTTDTAGVLTQLLRTFSEVKLGLLYGSEANGTARADSDLDLAVARDARRPLDDDSLLEISLACGQATGREVQVCDLARADGLFLKEVLTTGTVLLCRNPAVRAELIIRMLDFDADMLSNVRVIRQRNRERFLAGS